MLLLSQNCYELQVQSRHAYPCAGQPKLYSTILTKIANIRACDNRVLNVQCSPGPEQEGKVSLFLGHEFHEARFYPWLNILILKFKCFFHF